MGFEKIGTPKKVKSIPKRGTTSSVRGINAHTGKTNHGKSQPVVKVTMKGRMK